MSLFIVNGCVTLHEAAMRLVEIERLLRSDEELNGTPLVHFYSDVNDER